MISLLCKRAQSLLARVLREESGSAAVNVVFFLIGGIALTAFVVDATRVSADGARLKQATDAAMLPSIWVWIKSSSRVT